MNINGHLTERAEDLFWQEARLHKKRPDRVLVRREQYGSTLYVGDFQTPYQVHIRIAPDARVTAAHVTSARGAQCAVNLVDALLVLRSWRRVGVSFVRLESPSNTSNGHLVETPVPAPTNEGAFHIELSGPVKFEADSLQVTFSPFGGLGTKSAELAEVHKEALPGLPLLDEAQLDTQTSLSMEESSMLLDIYGKLSMAANYNYSRSLDPWNLRRLSKEQNAWLTEQWPIFLTYMQSKSPLGDEKRDKLQVYVWKDDELLKDDVGVQEITEVCVGYDWTHYWVGLPHSITKDASTLLRSVSSVVAALASFPAIAPMVPVIVAYIGAYAGVIEAFDHGNGVWLDGLLLMPGLPVPKTA